MEESILLSVKKNLNIDPEDHAFDGDLVLLINSVLAVLHQLGIGPDEGLWIEDDEATWGSLFSSAKLNAVKEYVYFSVRLSFDPPTASTLSYFKDRQKELEWRVMIAAEDLE